MKRFEKILLPVKMIRGGVNLEHNKNTSDCETIAMPAPKTVCIPLSQHIGAPANPIVKSGDLVYVGTMIGEAQGYVSAPVHSSVSGKVKSVSEKPINGRQIVCVEIESDGKMQKEPSLAPFAVNTAADIAQAARCCGLVGLGGAGFPTHVKLSPPEGSKIDTLIVNGAECEPYLTSDYRECMENYDDVINGVYLLKEKLGLEKVIICVENNKPKAIEKLYAVAADRRDYDDKIKLMKLPSRYPQGAEKVIVYSATGRKIPLGKLPSDVGCIVMNITSIAVLYRFITTGMPLVAKRITVDGSAVTSPKNLMVPIGSSIKDVLDFCGNIDQECERLIMGGPMMGSPITNQEIVIEKRTNAVLAMKPGTAPKTSACIRCGRCASVCPMRLYPASVEAAMKSGFSDRYEKLNVNYCMECGSCAYVCPARRPLTEVMRIAKSDLRRQKK